LALITIETLAKLLASVNCCNCQNVILAVIAVQMFIYCWKWLYQTNWYAGVRI